MSKRISRQATRANTSVSSQQSSPDDIRTAGWMVAAHNDYRQGGQFHTFWLFTKGSQAVKGEGRSDAEALNEIRRKLNVAAQE